MIMARQQPNGVAVCTPPESNQPMRGTSTALIFKTENQTMKKINLLVSLIALSAIAAIAAPVAVFVQDGSSIDYTPANAVAAGDIVVQESLLGIAKTAIAADELGALAVTGIFDVPSGSEVIAAGTLLYWDATAVTATTISTNGVQLGYSIAVTTTNDVVVRVLIK